MQLGFAHQGIMMVYEASTDWYDHYQRLLELSEDFGAKKDVHWTDVMSKMNIFSCKPTWTMNIFF